jgi:hypothetical protein
MSSRAATLAIGDLEGADRITAMEQLVAEMRKNVDWSKIRNDFRGAVLLARSAPEAAKVLGRFIRTLPKRPAWMNAIVKDDAWVEG